MGNTHSYNNIKQEDSSESISIITGANDRFKEFNLYRLDTCIAPTWKLNRCNVVDWKAFANSLLTNNERNNMIIKLVQNHPTRGKMLVITATNLHAQSLYDKFKGLGLDCGLATKKSSPGDCRILVGTHECDYRSTHLDLIIVVYPYSSHAKIAAHLHLERQIRHPDTIYLVDKHELCEISWEQAAKWCSNIKGVVSPLDVNN